VKIDGGAAAFGFTEMRRFEDAIPRLKVRLKTLLSIYDILYQVIFWKKFEFGLSLYECFSKEVYRCIKNFGLKKLCKRT